MFRKCGIFVLGFVRQRMVQLLLPFIVEVLAEKQREEDDMSYVW